jgi:hypothetical protein
VATHSLEALRAFARGREAFERTVDFQTIELHLKEAIRLDSTFALAHSLLAGAYGNSNRQQLAAQYATNAYELRDRLATPHSLFVTGAYHYHVTGDLDASETAFRTLMRDFAGYPPAVLVILSAIQMRTHRIAAAESSLVRLNEITGSLSVPQAYNLVSVQLWLGKTEAALANVNEFEAATGIPGLRARAYWALQRWDEADSILTMSTGSRPGDGALRAWHQSLIALIQGRLADFERLQRERVDAVPDNREADWDRIMLVANAHLVVLGDTMRARAGFARAADEYADVLASNSVALGRNADLLAAAGDTARGRALLDSFGTTGALLEGQRRFETVQARLLFAQGRTTNAITSLRATVAAPEVGFDCTNCDVIALAEILDAAGQADSAIARYQDIVQNRAIFPPFRSIMALYVPRSHERVGQLYDELGDTTNAVAHHQAFVDLWQDADPELQPRVQAAREAIARLSR